MNELEMIKAFAELDGVEVYTYKDDYLLTPNNNGYMTANGKTCTWYNPITDLALTMKAVIDYGVNIQHCTCFDCGPDGSGSYDIPYVCVSIKDPKGAHAKTPLNDTSHLAVSKAIIECILKSKGAWKD